MSIRREYSTIGGVKGGAKGGMNCGVFVVRSRSTQKKYVEKRISGKYIRDGTAKLEVEAMLQCRDHPSITRIKDFVLEPYETGYASIYMQYCELGTVDQLIEQFDKRNMQLSDEGFLWQMFWDLSLALCYLYHGTDVKTVQSYCERGLPAPDRAGWNSIIHRDIKPGNLFLTGGNRRTGLPTVVLGDFGLCATKSDVVAGHQDRTVFGGGTQDYWPPEAPKYSPFWDIYQLGVALHCVARMRRVPCEDRRELQEYPLPSKLKFPPLLRLVQVCVQRDPHSRPLQRNLPLLVHEGYKLWRKGRAGGSKLPSWALPSPM